MNLNQLKLFYLTAKYKSPSAAAEFLSISQPAVTTGIHRLEAHYGVRLLRRNGKNMTLTDAGEAFLRFIEKENIQISTPIEYSNNEAIKRAVELKAGIALISQKVAGKEIQRGELKAVPLSDAAIRRKFYLIRHKDRYVFRSLQNFFAEVKSWTGEYQIN